MGSPLEVQGLCRFEYNMSLYDTYLFIIIYFVDDMTSLPFYMFHSHISVRGPKLDLGSPIKDCG